MEPNVQTPLKGEIVALTWVRKAFSRSSGLSISQRVGKAVTLLLDVANARWGLRGCSKVGAGARLKGRMRVENQGSIAIGDHFSIVSNWTPVELITRQLGRIEIGNTVWVNFGALIAAQDRVTIGDRVMIGQHCIISDCEFPDLPAEDAPVSPARGGNRRRCLVGRSSYRAAWCQDWRRRGHHLRQRG